MAERDFDLHVTLEWYTNVYTNFRINITMESVR